MSGSVRRGPPSITSSASKRANSRSSGQPVRIGDGFNLFQLGNEIGTGANGVVFQAFNVLTGDFVAAKRFTINKNAKLDVIADIEAEIALMQKLHHPNVVKYIDTIRCPDANHLYVILEYMEQGSLAQVVKRFGAISEPLAAMYTIQVLVGLQYLHEQGVLHRDIKGANVLTTKEGVVKLCDFGVAMQMQTQQQTGSGPPGKDATPDVVGTPYWMAPEIIEMAPPTAMSDIWSVGCLVVELVTGRPPYYDMPPMTAMFHIVQDEYPPLPLNASEELVGFLMLCFQKEPSRRETAESLLLHPWLRPAVASQEQRSPAHSRSLGISSSRRNDPRGRGDILSQDNNSNNSSSSSSSSNSSSSSSSFNGGLSKAAPQPLALDGDVPLNNVRLVAVELEIAPPQIDESVEQSLGMEIRRLHFEPLLQDDHTEDSANESSSAVIKGRKNSTVLNASPSFEHLDEGASSRFGAQPGGSRSTPSPSAEQGHLQARASASFGWGTTRFSSSSLSLSGPTTRSRATSLDDCTIDDLSPLRTRLRLLRAEKESEANMASINLGAANGSSGGLGKHPGIAEGRLPRTSSRGSTNQLLPSSVSLDAGDSFHLQQQNMLAHGLRDGKSPSPGVGGSWIDAASAAAAAAAASLSHNQNQCQNQLWSDHDYTLGVDVPSNLRSNTPTGFSAAPVVSASLNPFDSGAAVSSTVALGDSLVSAGASRRRDLKHGLSRQNKQLSSTGSLLDEVALEVASGPPPLPPSAMTLFNSRSGSNLPGFGLAEGVSDRDRSIINSGNKPQAAQLPILYPRESALEGSGGGAHHDMSRIWSPATHSHAAAMVGSGGGGAYYDQSSNSASSSRAPIRSSSGEQRGTSSPSKLMMAIDNALFADMNEIKAAGTSSLNNKVKEVLFLCERVIDTLEAHPEVARDFVALHGVMILCEILELAETAINRKAPTAEMLLKVINTVIAKNSDAQDQLALSGALPTLMKIVESIHQQTVGTGSYAQPSTITPIKGGVTPASLTTGLVLSFNGAMEECAAFLWELTSSGAMAAKVLVGTGGLKAFVQLLTAALHVINKLSQRQAHAGLAVTGGMNTSPPRDFSSKRTTGVGGGSGAAGHSWESGSTVASQVQSDVASTTESTPSTRSLHVQTPQGLKHYNMSSADYEVIERAKRVVYYGVDCVTSVLKAEWLQGRSSGQLLIKLGVLAPLGRAFSLLMGSFRYSCMQSHFNIQGYGSRGSRRDDRNTEGRERERDREREKETGDPPKAESFRGYSAKNTPSGNNPSSESKDNLDKVNADFNAGEDGTATSDHNNSPESKCALRIAQIIRTFSYGDSDTLDFLTRIESGILSTIMITLQSPELRLPFPRQLHDTARLSAAAAANVTNAGALPPASPAPRPLLGGTSMSTWMPSEEYLVIIDTLLKSLKNIALEIANLGCLDKAGTIVALVPLLNGPFGSRFQENIIPCLFNLCRMNLWRQEQAAVAGIIPYLMKILHEKSSLDHKPFALTMLCDFAYSSDATRIELWRHDGVALYSEIFSQPVVHWQSGALNALANWLLNDVQNVEALLVMPPHINGLIELFRSATPASLRVLLRPLIDMMMKSEELSRHLSASGLFVSCLVRRLGETSDAFLLRSLIALIRLIHTNHSCPSTLVLNFGIYEKLRRLAEASQAAQQVVVFEKVKDLLKEIQHTTFS